MHREVLVRDAFALSMIVSYAPSLPSCCVGRLEEYYSPEEIRAWPYARQNEESDHGLIDWSAWRRQIRSGDDPTKM